MSAVPLASLPAPGAVPGLVAGVLGAAPPRAAVERAVREVLGDPQFQQDLVGLELSEGVMQAVIRFVKAAIDWVLGLGDGLAGLSATQPAIFWLIISAMVAVLGLLLWHIAYSLSLAFRSGPATPGSAAPALDGPAAWRDFLAGAERLAAAGEHAEAIRHLLLALVARLEERRLAVARGLTNRELVARLDLAPAARQALAGFVGTVDRLWYGRQAATADDFQGAAALVRRFVAAVPAAAGDDGGREGGG